MINFSINLLPANLKANRKISLQNTTLLSLCITAVIIYVILLAIIFSLKTTLALSEKVDERQIDNLQVEIASFKDIQAQINFINDRGAELKNKDADKNKLMSNIITEIAQSTPSDVQIQQLSANVKTKPNFKITGATTSIAEAVKFKEKLEESQFFGETNLQSAATDSTTHQVIFNIDFNLQTSGESQK